MTDETADRDDKGQFAPGNQLWRRRAVHGRPPVFANGDDLWSACVEYFEWSAANPLYEYRAFANGAVVPVPKMRAMTLKALWLHLGIDRTTWSEWRARSDLSPVTSRVDSIIHIQKFEGAAAGLLSPNIIARDLGLAEKSEHTADAGGNTLAALLERVAKDGERL